MVSFNLKASSPNTVILEVKTVMHKLEKIQIKSLTEATSVQK